MEPLPPISVPLKSLWRECRVRGLPLAGFVAGAIAVGWIWARTGQINAFPGVAEGVRSLITSPQPGAIESLLVEPYQLVEQGALVAVILPSDPRAKLDLWRSDLELARLSWQPLTTEAQAADVERLRLELLRMKSETLADQIKLELADNQVRRQTALHDQRLISDDLYEQTVKARDSLRVELAAKSNAVELTERRLAELQAGGNLTAPGLRDTALDQVSKLASERQRLGEDWGAITLRAPISGMVTAVHRQAGELVQEGEPVLTVSSLHSERVVGYLRQPFPILPQPGVAAVLITREWKRTRFLGRVSQIGAQVEMITNSLALVGPGRLIDSGLPIIIALPPEAAVRPGEVLDIEIQTSTSSPLPFRNGGVPDRSVTPPL